MSSEPKVLIVPTHPGVQYHFCRVGLPTYFLGHWDQFQYWRPKPGNVHNLLAAFEEKHLEFGPADYAKLLPKGIAKYTTKGVYDSSKKTHLSFTQGSGHGGSHPHLAHEFATALAKDRDPFPNAKQSANWTCVGLCAHESALNGGEVTPLPKFTLS